MIKSKEPPKFAPGNLVCHSSNRKERYKLTLILDHSAWAIRQSDEEEVMLLIENLAFCQ